MSTHNLCFRAKIRNNVYPCTPQFHYIKVGCKGCSLHGHVCMMTLLLFACGTGTTGEELHKHLLRSYPFHFVLFQILYIVQTITK